MSFLVDPEFWARLGTIVMIDLTLAGDNALVIALAVRALPARQQFWGRVLGTLGAVALRVILITVATVALRIPFLQLIGGLLLVWIAIKLVRGTTGAEGHLRSGTSVARAVWVILVADAVMSLDNVLGVAAAAHGDLRLVVIGIAISLPLVVWGSGLLARLMNRRPWLIWLGGAVLGYVAGDMMFDDGAVRAWLGDVAMPIGQTVSVALAVLMALLGWWSARRTGRGVSIGERGFVRLSRRGKGPEDG
jgi:YjbE family integral membrane protein